MKTSGFTLIELIMVVALLAIVTGLTVPAMGNLFSDNRITSEANELMAGIQFARHQAVTRNTFVTACPGSVENGCRSDGRWDRGWIVFIDADNNGQVASEDDVLRVGQPVTGLLMHSGGRPRVRFQPHGGAYGFNLTIRVCDAEGATRPRAIVVSNPGRARVSRDIDPDECRAG